MIIENNIVKCYNTVRHINQNNTNGGFIMAKTKHYRVAKKHAKKDKGLFIPHHRAKKAHKLLTVLIVLVFLKGLFLGISCGKHRR